MTLEPMNRSTFSDARLQSDYHCAAPAPTEPDLVVCSEKIRSDLLGYACLGSRPF